LFFRNHGFEGFCPHFRKTFHFQQS
jgi:hypothetical protein